MILLSQEFTKELFTEIRLAKRECLVACAFIKFDALKALAENFADCLDTVTVIARWQKRDLVAGVSDLEVFEYCRDHGWRFGIDQNLHGKLYLLDNEVAFLGSANLTRRGLSYGGIGNSEFGTRLDIGEIDVQKIDKFVSNDVTWMTNDLYKLIATEVKESSTLVVPSAEYTWTAGISLEVAKPINYMWIEDLLFAAPNELLRLNLGDSAVLHDFELLGLDFDDITERTIVEAFSRSKCYAWILGRLNLYESISFGLLSKELHGAILNDPTPYRREIKDFVRIMFEWCEYAHDVFTITQHTRTKSIALESTSETVRGCV